VHFVVPEADAGPIIAQAAVPVRDDDTAETLAARVLEVEHRIYPLALRLLAEGRVKMIGGPCLIEGGGSPGGALFVPGAQDASEKKILSVPLPRPPQNKPPGARPGATGKTLAE